MYVFLCYKHSVSVYLFAIAVALSATPSLFAQCPSESVRNETEIRTLKGSLVFHDGIEEWFELRLDQPQCGEASIELFEQGSNSLATLRGCRIKSQGALIISARGNIRQIVKEIEAVGPCVHKAPFPDFSSVKPDTAIHGYRVEAPPTWRCLISIGRQGWVKMTQTWGSPASGPSLTTNLPEFEAIGAARGPSGHGR